MLRTVLRTHTWIRMREAHFLEAQIPKSWDQQPTPKTAGVSTISRRVAGKLDTPR